LAFHNRTRNLVAQRVEQKIWWGTMGSKDLPHSGSLQILVLLMMGER